MRMFLSPFPSPTCPPFFHLPFFSFPFPTSLSLFFFQFDLIFDQLNNNKNDPPIQKKSSEDMI